MPKILLVEDNKMNQLVAIRTLEHQGHEVECVTNGNDAVDRTALDHFDAILMDCMMPGMDGFQATTLIRERETNTGAAYTPIIGLSARAMDGDRKAALAVGMNDYLTKPLRVEELRFALQQWITT